jgi:cytochrome o ubiquinol oxidase subunit II
MTLALETGCEGYKYAVSLDTKRDMKKSREEVRPYLFGVFVALTLAIGFAALLYIFRDHIAFFNPAGEIAMQQRNLFLFAIALMMIVILPVFFMLFFFAWKFRETNKKATYRPLWDGNKKLEVLWWGVPIAIISILAGVTWVTSHSLDPFKPLSHEKTPLKVQVVALEWKWLFIYPEEQIASVNELHIPTDRPIEFTITSDAPMNSFWIPKLGGQIYAMAGMSTKLHLIANNPGVYKGSSANISGKGFADMKFNVIASPENEYASWVNTTKDLRVTTLTSESYAFLKQQSIEKNPKFYADVAPDLYDTIVHSYMDTEEPEMNHEMEGM